MLKIEKKIGTDSKLICSVCGKRILGSYCKYSKPNSKNCFYTHSGECSESFENSAISNNVDFTTGKVTVSAFEIWYNKEFNGYIGKNYDVIKKAYFAGRKELTI